MSLVAVLGPIETGLIHSLFALGVFLAFRILNFPDLTVDGSFAFGAAVTAVLIVKGWNPYAATAAALAAGCLAGLCTGFLNVHLRVLNLLASILTMIALYSVNIRIMGGPAVPLLGQPSVLSPVSGLGISQPWPSPAYLLGDDAAVCELRRCFLHSP